MRNRAQMQPELIFSEARLGAKRSDLVSAALVLFLLSLPSHMGFISARPVSNSARFVWPDFHVHGKLEATSERHSSHVAGTSGILDLSNLRRGNIYAVNVQGGTFHLERIDLTLLQESLNPLTTASLSATLRAAYPEENVGWAWFADTYSEDGWYRLEIRMDEAAPFPDVVKARAAGFVEGNLQGPHMYRYWTNYRSNEYRGRGEAPSQELYNWFDEQYSWMVRHVERATGWSLATLRGDPPIQPATTATSVATSVAAAAATPTGLAAAATEAEAASGVADLGFGGGGGGGRAPGAGMSSFDRRYWMLVGLVAAQFEGLARGFWSSVVEPERNMTWHELYALNAVGDLYELNVLFPPTAEGPPPTAAGVTAAVRQRHYTPGHGDVGEYGYGELLDCSAIIKLDTSGISDDGGNGDIEGDDDGGTDGDGGAIGPEVEPAGGGGAAATSSSTIASSASEPKSGLSKGADETRLRSRSRTQRRSLSQVEQQQQAQLLPRQARVGATATAASAAATRGGGGGRDDGGRPPLVARRARNFWSAHNTWRPYYDMVRTWKVYDMPWAASGPITVSSSPGLIHSKDDWYTTDTFVVMETTNGVYNKQLYDLIQPKCVLMWQRAQLANFGARLGSEWVDLFARHNSGTYNNQWMVLDVNQLQRARVRSDVLWVLEQVPGRIISKDVTQVLLEQGYWASYNVPYFPEIYNLTGYPQPSIYYTCPRARIFSREQSWVTSRSDLMALMRLNRYQEDPLSQGLPNNAIAARYDLPAAADPSGKPRNWTQKAYGAVDAKVVDLESFRARRTYVVNGPTAEDQPAFRWSSEPAFDAIRRDGCVDEFCFGWQTYEAIVGPPLETRRDVYDIPSST